MLQTSGYILIYFINQSAMLPIGQKELIEGTLTFTCHRDSRICQLVQSSQVSQDACLRYEGAPFMILLVAAVLCALLIVQ